MFDSLIYIKTKNHFVKTDTKPQTSRQQLKTELDCIITSKDQYMTQFKKTYREMKQNIVRLQHQEDIKHTFM